MLCSGNHVNLHLRCWSRQFWLLFLWSEQNGATAERRRGSPPKRCSAIWLRPGVQFRRCHRTRLGQPTCRQRGPWSGGSWTAARASTKDAKAVEIGVAAQDAETGKKRRQEGETIRIEKRRRRGFISRAIVGEKPRSSPHAPQLTVLAGGSTAREEKAEFPRMNAVAAAMTGNRRCVQLLPRT